MGWAVREIGTVTAHDPETIASEEPSARYLSEISDVTARVRDLVRGALRSGCLPLLLGGDHSIAMGSVSAVARHHRQSGEKLGLVWVDAHTDMNTPDTTPSGNVHGMPLAALLGYGGAALGPLASDPPEVAPENVSILGVRSVDGPERDLVRQSGVRVLTMSEIDERGMAACMDEAIERACNGTVGFHLSFDLDSIDPMEAPGVGTPVKGGLTFREAHLACEKVARSGSLVSLEVVELNPVLDVENRTAALAVGLVASALGKTIL
jgi:arginase